MDGLIEELVGLQLRASHIRRQLLLQGDDIGTAPDYQDFVDRLRKVCEVLDLISTATRHQEKPNDGGVRSHALGYRDGLGHAFHYAVRHHREGLEMLLRLAESEGDELLTQLLREDLSSLGEF
jgi:hypothetical protein